LNEELKSIKNSGLGHTTKFMLKVVWRREFLHERENLRLERKLSVC
jgi:hypothetical protein